MIRKNKLKLLTFFALITGLVFTAFVAIFAYLLPFRTYQKALREGMDNSYLSLSPQQLKFLSPTNTESIDIDLSRDPEKWKVFHFSHFEIPLSTHHNKFMLIPLIEEYENQLSLGVSFLGFNQREMARFRTDGESSFRLQFFADKIFELPIFRNALLKIPEQKIWKDLFTLDLNLHASDANPLAQLKAYSSMSFHELVYRLHILKLRHQLFPPETIAFHYYSERNIGVLDIQEFGIKDSQVLKDGLDPEYRNEILFLYEKRNFYRLRLLSYLHEPAAVELRNRVLKQLSYKFSDEDSSYPLFGEFRSLSNKDRMDQKGMTYLYSSWSHVPDRKDFLMEMIQILEQGKSFARHLDPLYRYSYRIYGSTFSKYVEYFRETDDHKARRLYQEEQKAAVEELKVREISSEVAVPLTGTERIRYLLKKAKDEKMNIDREDGSLLEY